MRSPDSLNLKPKMSFTPINQQESKNTGSGKRRASYTAAYKLQVIEVAETKGNRAAAREFKISETNVRLWRKTKDVIKCQRKTAKAPGRGSKVHHPELEKQLIQYIHERAAQGHTVSMVEIRLKALHLTKDLGPNSSFKASTNWCYFFMKRHGLPIRRRKSVGASTARKDVVAREMNKLPLPFGMSNTNILLTKPYQNYSEPDVDSFSMPSTVVKLEPTSDSEDGDISNKCAQNKSQNVKLSGASCSNEYFNSYVDISVHELMLKDKPRTLSYMQFIDQNKHLFNGKVVLDVGAGTGILSCFAARAGAKMVYAVEASNMASICESIVYQNDLQDQITVIQQPVEDVILNCRYVDIILSEWMGFYLLHESMLDSVLYARDKWLSPNGGIMLPSYACLCMAPVAMKKYHSEHFAFWKNVYGFDFSPAIPLAMEKFFKQPIIEVVKEDQLMSSPQKILDIDLKTVTLSEVQFLSKELHFKMEKSGSLHGFVSWFDVVFLDPNGKVPESKLVLSTSPNSELTHWKQTVFFLPTPLLVDANDSIPCNLTLFQDTANKRHYNICIEVPVDIVQEDSQTDENLNITADDIENPEQHSIPCNCNAPRCKIIKVIMEKYTDEQAELQNNDEVTVTSEEIGEDSELDASDSTN